MNKNLIFIILLNTISFHFVFASEQLEKADSLFANQRYTEAFEVYKEIFENEKKASPSMLLKMAFIQEGLEHSVDALYFLNLYYAQTSNGEVLTKIKEIAEELNLNGYEFSDQEVFGNFIVSNNPLIQLTTGVLSFLSIGYFLWVRFRLKRKSLPVLVLQFFMMAFLFLSVNEFYIKPKAIIIEEEAILRSAPSSAAEPLRTSLNPGHKVSILDRQEVWTKILWEEEEAFIRTGNLEII